MSNILTKAFDATKRIARTVFVGAPNLFTTSDVNRQVEAFKYHLDSIEKRVGVLSDLTFTSFKSYQSDLGINIDFTDVEGTYLEAGGADFSSLLASFPNRITVRFGHPRWLYIKASQSLVTYSDDNTHEIAGALFEDSTSLEAANQLVYSNCILENTETDPTGRADCVAVLLYFEVFDDGSYIQDINFMPKGETLISKVISLGRVQFIKYGAIKARDTLNTSLEKLISKFQISLGVNETSWANLRARVYVEGGTWADSYEGMAEAPKAKLANGQLLLTLGSQFYNMDEAANFEFGTSQEATQLKYFIGELPASIVSWLEAHYAATLPSRIYLGPYAIALFNTQTGAGHADLSVYLERVQGAVTGGYSWIIIARGKAVLLSKGVIVINSGDIDVNPATEGNIATQSPPLVTGVNTLDASLAVSGWTMRLLSPTCCYMVPLLQIFGV